MPDLGAAVGGMIDLFGPVAKQLLGPLIKALLRSTLGTLFLAALLLGGAYYIASRNPHGHPLVAVLITFIACLILGTMLVIKRTVLAALRFGIARLQLGQRTVGALFARALGVQPADAAQAGERGNLLARTVERLPLAQLETKLRDAASFLRSEAGGARGFLLGRLHRMLVDKVESVTLSRLRAEGEQAGGIDVIKVRDELSAGIESRLLGMVDGMMMKFTVLLVLAMAGIALLSALFV
ncbi:MAG: hypothetical protein U1A78_36595 [Polyangia bacterium]